MAAPDGEILFHDADLLVRHVPGDGTACVVTFAPLSDAASLGRPGFGEGFFRARRIPAVHVVPRGNDWYQYPGMLAAVAAIRKAVRPYVRVLAYGSSMGAYAALRLGPAAGAHAVLALSPQFSVRPDRVPFEYRWSAVGEAIVPVWEDTFPLPDCSEAYLVHDPRDLDARHANLYAAQMPVIPISLRGAGHPVTGFLNGAGMLQTLALCACAGPLDPAAVGQAAWAARRRAPQYYRYLAERTDVGAWQVAALRRAASLAPGDAGLSSRLACALGRMRLFDEALDLHRRALAPHPDLAPLLAEYASTLAASGNLAASLDVLERLHAQGNGSVAPRIATLHAHLAPPAGRRAAISHDPGPRPPPGTPPITAAATEAGFVVHGPFKELRPGRYEVTFTIEALGGPRRLPDPRTACVLDVAIHDGRTILAEASLTVGALRSGRGRVAVPFTMPEWTACQFRVRSKGRVAISVEAQRPLRRLCAPD